MRRRDIGNNVVEIQHLHGTERWLVIKKVLDASKISIQTKSGADVESTEIALAFPISKQGKKSTIQVNFTIASFLLIFFFFLDSVPVLFVLSYHIISYHIISYTEEGKCLQFMNN